ncbi:YnfA family protein [Neobacillus drentensis]|uniref:YnfA family protein n=1 Tax=Neobacillus drentensis TaxID=220684 RepID=UPI002FFF0ADB
MIKAIVLFILAGLAEIGGGYLIWLWLREGKPIYWGIFGGITLALYGVIATFQSFPSFGRVYAAYGGVFIVLSILWGWGIEKKTPDLSFSDRRLPLQSCAGRSPTISGR